MHTSDLAQGEGDFITVQEAARRFSISTSLLYKLIREKRIPSFRFGHAIRLESGGLRDFVAASAVSKD